MATEMLDHETEIKILLFKDVTNASDLRKMIVKGELECSLINPTMVVDCFQVKTAAFKAVTNRSRNKMTTKTVFTEIIYNLACKRSISKALKVFGLNDQDKSVLVVLLNDEGNEKSNRLLQCISGKQIALDELQSLTNSTAICKEYGITETETQTGTLLEAVMGRMATKEFVAY